MPRIHYSRFARMRRGLRLLIGLPPPRLQKLAADSDKDDVKWLGAILTKDRIRNSRTTTLVSALGEAGVAILVMDLDENAGLLIRDVNRAFEECTGFTAEKLVGKNPGRLPALFEWNILGQLDRSLRDGQPFRAGSVIQGDQGDERAIEWIVSPIRNTDGAPIHWVAVLGDASHAQLSRQEFEAELQHRTRNLLGTVGSVAARTLGETDEAAAFRARLAALGRVQGLKVCVEEKVDLGELIRGEIEAKGVTDGQVTIEGRSIGFPRAKAAMLALAVHELANNAGQHGVFASRRGNLSICWWTYGSGVHRRLTLRWKETRGQSAQATRRGRGYGSELLERALPYALGATTELEIGSAGVHYQIDLPLPESLRDFSPIGAYSPKQIEGRSRHMMEAVS